MREIQLHFIERCAGSGLGERCVFCNKLIDIADYVTCREENYKSIPLILVDGSPVVMAVPCYLLAERQRRQR